MNQPFKGDYLEMGKNPKYHKLSSAVDEKVLLADVVNKINRANGKVPKEKKDELPFTALLQPCAEQKTPKVNAFFSGFKRARLGSSC